MKTTLLLSKQFTELPTKLSTKLSIVIILFSGCTWVELGQQGAQVMIAKKASVSHCRKVGDIRVKGKHQLIGINRSNKKVILELETLARNEAAQIGANTIVAKATPTSGQQDYLAYQCRS